MRGCRWLSLPTIGLAGCLLAGCLRHTLPPEIRMPRPNVSAHSQPDSAEEGGQPPSLSDYQVSHTPMVKLDVQPAAATETVAEKRADTPAEKSAAAKPFEPSEMPIASAELPSPKTPDDPPEPRKETPSASLTRPEAPSVQVLRALLDRRPEEEINEPLKAYGPFTRDAFLVLTTSLAQLQQNGGVEGMSPQELAVCSDRLSTLTASLRSRAQLILERMCFCRSIKNFGDYAPLPPEQVIFQPGEAAHVYVQVRNISSRRQREKYVTVFKVRCEIFDENSRDKPPITWVSQLREDISTSPRQDYYINFHFWVPNCPAGMYTMRIVVEDWTDAPPESKQVPDSRIAQRTLDFRVGGGIGRPTRLRIAEAERP